MKKSPDIDIDFSDRNLALEGLDYTRAVSIDDEGNVRPHNVGVYFQDIPSDPITGLTTIDTNEAESRGYFKVDFLNVSLYNGVRDEAHLLKLMEQKPIWKMLDDKFFVEQLWHIHDHFDIVEKMKPRSIIELAMLLGVIRPSKRHLQDKSWSEIAKTVWEKPQIGDKGYGKNFFKKPHAVAYAIGIVVQMNLIVEDAR